MRPLRSVIVAEIITGSSTPRASNSSSMRGDRRLGVERVEDRLEQQQVGAAVDQPADLLAVRVAHARECLGAERRVVDVGRDRQRAVGGPDRAGDEPRSIGRATRPLVGGRPSQTRARDVQVVGEAIRG